MIATWPDELPKPDRDGYQQRRQDGRRKTRPDTGPMRFRRRFSNIAREVNLQLTLTRAEKAIFDRFYDETTAGGSLLFRMPDPTTDGWALLTHDGAPLIAAQGGALTAGAIWLCSFGEEPPAETIAGTLFRESFTILVMP